MIAALAWLTGLPWEVLALAGIVLTSFWTAVIVHRVERKQRVQLDAEWVRFTGRTS